MLLFSNPSPMYSFNGIILLNLFRTCRTVHRIRASDLQQYSLLIISYNNVRVRVTPYLFYSSSFTPSMVAPDHGDTNTYLRYKIGYHERFELAFSDEKEMKNLQVLNKWFWFWEETGPIFFSAVDYRGFSLDWHFSIVDRPRTFPTSPGKLLSSLAAIDERRGSRRYEESFFFPPSPSSLRSPLYLSILLYVSSRWAKRVR